ncbi:hypothetical protein [Streptomyces sp. NPDC059122]|uniref:hypothetical protein n=1 Tax=Streptomyces sp. NPDC059122 TaxID=3346732 RepID=UPI0036C4AAFC
MTRTEGGGNHYSVTAHGDHSIGRPMTRTGGSGEIHHSPTARGDHAISAGSTRNVFIRWVGRSPRARWLPLLASCAGLVIAGSQQPEGLARQCVLWYVLCGLSLVTAVARVLIRWPRDTRVVVALSLVSVLATVAGWLVFQSV